jgi:hypothetical protein
MNKERPINGVEPNKNEDDIQRRQLSPRGVPSGRDPARQPNRDPTELFHSTAPAAEAGRGRPIVRVIKSELSPRPGRAGSGKVV